MGNNRSMVGKRQMLQLTVATLLLGLCTTAALYAYHRYLRNLRVAVIGWRDSDWVAWREVAVEAGYTLHRFDPDDIGQTPLGNYHAVLIRAPGYRPDDGDRAVFAAARAAGTRLVMLPPRTDVAEAEDNLEPEHREAISDYLRHGGQANVRGLLRYLARELAGRDGEVPPVVERP